MWRAVRRPPGSRLKVGSLAVASPRTAAVGVRAALAPVLAALLLVLIALRFAQPIEDGDLFWHMAYGAQLLAGHALRTDPTLYSWTPTSDALIYCAWTGEILFRLVWDAFGQSGIFALRYISVLVVVFMLALYARRVGMLARAETWLILLVVVLGSVVATLPKPEMLSLILWNGLVFTWFGLLLAAERGQSLLRWIYAIPVLMLVWVNTHGAFILAAPMIALMVALGWWVLPRRAAWHMVAAAVLCGVATMVNPYGPLYPAQLLAETLGTTPRPDIAWNNAFQPTLGAAGNFYHLPELLGWMALLLTMATVKSRRRSWLAAVLPFLFYLPLDLLYVRATFLLPALFGYGALYLARGSRLPGWVAAAASILFLFLAGRATADAALRPAPDSWLGFGIGYAQPVDEAEYLLRSSHGTRIINTYNVGGYLLWRLYPRYTVMVDQRSFPYVSWFDDLKLFTRTEDPAQFAAFLAHYQGDVALVDFQVEPVWRSFMAQPGWRPAFYGPAAAVFVRTTEPAAPIEAAVSLTHLRNAYYGVRIFDFATAAGDYRTAWTLLAQMEGPLRREVAEADLARMRAYRQGQAALRQGDYAGAWSQFSDGFAHRPISGQNKTIMLLLRALQVAAPDDPRRATVQAGLARLAALE